MDGTAFDLLEEPLFRVHRGPESLRCSLPALLALLARGEAIEFDALRPHQQHAWHAFLVQLAALACARGGHELDALVDAEAWSRVLTDLAEDRRAWQLWVADLSAPAFLQPPVPEGSLVGFKTLLETPDRLDLLMTARNHDLKRRRMVRAHAEHWVFALVSLQTMEGVGGRLNYGISRMNGGLSNRPCVAAAASDEWAVRFERDTRIWLEQRSALLEPGYGYASSGLALLWCRPWDGTESLPPALLDPFYIECCRRIRIEWDGVRPLQARAATSAAPRVAAEERHGDTGDVWTPVAREDGRALTVGPNGFSYGLLQELLFSADWRPAAAQVLRPTDGPTPLLRVQALARGQGKTQGFHERTIPIPARARLFFSSSEGRERLGRRSTQMVQLAAEARLRVLRPALLTLLSGGSGRVDFKDERPRQICARLDAQIDDVFFRELFERVNDPEERALGAWQRLLFIRCESLFEEARGALAIPLARALQAQVLAEAQLRRSARRHLPGAFDEEGAHDAAATA